jgi:FKBP-type peptidyl-prolyl cis-trans isomerase
MKHGDAVKLIVPSKLAYGDFGWQGIPPYTPLIFEISVE